MGTFFGDVLTNLFFVFGDVLTNSGTFWLGDVLTCTRETFFSLKDRDLFNVACNETDNISSQAIL